MPKKHIDWDEIMPYLGVWADEAVGAFFGLSTNTVKSKRLKLGIAPASYLKTLNRPGVKLSWTEEQIDMLGRISDHELGLRWGISSTAVAKKRRSLGIPPVHPCTYQRPPRSKDERLPPPETPFCDPEELVAGRLYTLVMPDMFQAKNGRKVLVKCRFSSRQGNIYLFETVGAAVRKMSFSAHQLRDVKPREIVREGGECDDVLDESVGSECEYVDKRCGKSAYVVRRAIPQTT